MPDPHLHTAGRAIQIQTKLAAFSGPSHKNDALTVHRRQHGVLALIA
jgi:hypothetical protein